MPCYYLRTGAGGTVRRHEARPGRRKHEACCRRERGRGDGGSGGREPCVGAPGALCRRRRETVAGYGKQVWLQALRCRRSRERKQYLVAALGETFRESVCITARPKRKKGVDKSKAEFRPKSAICPEKNVNKTAEASAILIQFGKSKLL